MKRTQSWIAKISAVVVAVFGLAMTTANAVEPVKAEFPVLVTSFGQAPDGNTITVLAKRIGAQLTYDTLATPEKVKEFKTVIVSIGVSLKGFGAAGVNLDTEIARAADILKVAKDDNIKVIGFHIGGEGRRDQMSDKIIETYAGDFDTLVVYKDGNQDGIFTKIAQEKNIPFIELEKLPQVSEVLKQILK
ncbi:MAG: DUF6305 family protein [Methylobacteriaceae bacterium]|jgi:hypothetical protein|nr:DUF6305 family protein [Methylobacteriaceae bacterium]